MTFQKKRFEVLSICLLVAWTLCLGGCLRDERAVLIGVSQTPHEQILGWMVRELAVRKGIECQMREVSAGIANIQPALESNSLQVGIEYANSAWKHVLRQKSAYHAGDLALVQKRYKSLGLYWYSLPMVQNEYSLAVSRSLALSENLKTLSDLARISPSLTLGAATPFFEEEDGYPLLSEAYGIEFKTVRNLPEDGLVEAVLNQKADVIPARSLDGQIARTEFVFLEDDLQVHDDADTGLVMSHEAVMMYPQLASIAQDIGRVLSGSQLALEAMNVVMGNETPQQAALYLLKSKNLIYEKQ